MFYSNAPFPFTEVLGKNWRSIRNELDALDVLPGEAYLGFGAPPEGLSPSLNLSIRGDLEEAAATASDTRAPCSTRL